MAGRIQILERASGVTPLSLKKIDKQIILPLRKGDYSRLLALVTETSDSQSSACEQVAGMPTTAPCARLHVFCYPLFFVLR